MGKAAKISCYISLAQILTLLLAYAIAYYRKLVHTPDLDFGEATGYLALISLFLFIPNVILLIYEIPKELKKKHLSSWMLGLAALVILIWVTGLLFPGVFPSSGCGCAPRGGI